MNQIRQIALSCTAKKIAYRQSKDGIVVSFLIHHAEMPDKLAVADLGTPYMLALVEVDDNDQPKAAQERAPAPGPEPLTARVAAPSIWETSEREAAVRRAGYLCKDARFQTFLKEEFAGGWKLFSGRGNSGDEDTAIRFVRWRCGVQSRAEIKDSDEAHARWQELDAAYQAWLRE